MIKRRLCVFSGSIRGNERKRAENMKNQFTIPAPYAILSQYEQTPIPRCPVTPAGSLVYGEIQ
ncbi:MAG: hypothetical protein KH110_11100 [Clostridiales bacterium]|uniref:Uncharacterized protein n=1 Tax=Enterocloster alcoholdehydrogenati TaxID=2547410 RepID=A0ABQ0B0H1_9FIRM|nr:hypothetical protein [Clostridiales bacterium]